MPGILLAAVCTLGALNGCGAASSGAEGTNRFDVEAAWHLVERQVDVGQRPAGSPQLRELAADLRPLLPHGRFESIPGDPALRNVVGTLPGRKPGIVIGAHYDTLAKPRGFVGANNGAAGTAVVIEVARALRRLRADTNPREVRFVLFDGEEPARELPEEVADFYHEGLRGSRAYASAHPNGTTTMILLDYVGNRGLLLHREGTSDPRLWNRVLMAAEAVGASKFFSAAPSSGIIDDHTPFLRMGIPAVDLIDWSYPGHSLSDRLDRLSPRSLDGVGETVVQLVEELRTE